MKKIIYSMFHGNTKTKCFLWSLCLLGLMVVVSVLLAIILSQPVYGGAAFILGMLFLVISQSYSLDTLAKEPRKQKKADEDKEEERAQNDFSHYDTKMLKKIMRRYKVRKEHKTIIIDSAPAYRIKQCPAFVWIEGNNLHFLLLEKEPRQIEVPMKDIKQVGYHKGVKAKPDKDYSLFTHASLVAKVFREHLPSYQEKVEDGKHSYYKNLYVVGTQIAITNMSAKNIFSLLSVPFVIDNDLTRTQKYSKYFKEAYRYSVLCNDLVITKTEYSQRIIELLDRVADADIPGSEFMKTLRDMLRYRFITREDVVACSQRRKSI